MTHPKITVIVPVYNAEETIGCCIDSILAQTLKEFEAIFVDDCSTDGSAEIIERFREKDDRVRLIKLEKNGGQGRARNIGIEKARGDYLSFVDSDDVIAPDFFERLYQKAAATGADIVKGLAYMVNDGDSISDKSACIVRPINSAIRCIPKSKRSAVFCFSSEHWSAIYRRDFIMANGIRYGMSRIAQDTVFLLKVAAYRPVIELENAAAYYYIQRGGSVIHALDMARFYASLDALEEQIDFINANETEYALFSGHINAFLKGALASHSYLCAKVSEAEAHAFLNRAHSIFGKYIHIDKISEVDYAIDAFMRSKGRKNIAIDGRIIGLTDESVWQIGALERLVDHINRTPENRREGLHYLQTALSRVYRKAFLAIQGPAREQYEAFSKKVRTELMRLDDMDTVRQELPLLNCLIEYGADLFEHKPWAEKAHELGAANALLDQVSRIISFLDEHVCVPRLIAYAKRIINSVLKSAVKLRTAENGAEYSELLGRIVLEAKKLDDIAAAHKDERRE